MKQWFIRVLAVLAALALLASVGALAESVQALPAVESTDKAAVEVEFELGTGSGEEIVFSALSYAANKVTLGVKETFRLDPTGYTGKMTFKSSNTAVAKVSASGKITAKKVGKATISLILKNKVVGKCKVTVKAAPTSLSLNKRTASIKVGDELKLKAKLPSGTASNAISWTTSDSSVAEVDDTGLVTGVDAGTATITAKTYNGKKATCEVTVKGSKGVCRALLVGNVHFGNGSDLPSCGYDVKNMAAMLKRVKSPDGGAFQNTIKTDVDRDGLFKAIRTAFKGATSNDVSLFYYSGHGDNTDYVEEYPDQPEMWQYCGELPMVPVTSDNWVTLPELADALKAVPGKVIILVDTCGSGSGVYTPEDGENGILAARAFDHAVTETFANADPGLYLDKAGNACEADQALANFGEYRVANKFYVLTAARYNEYSFCDDESGMFTNWLITGVGGSGESPADEMGDGDGIITLKELFNYISSVGDDYPIRYQEDDGTMVTAYQHVQAYPRNSGFKMFRY